jgi:hypothetical protein
MENKADQFEIRFYCVQNENRSVSVFENSKTRIFNQWDSSDF